MVAAWRLICQMAQLSKTPSDRNEGAHQMHVTVGMMASLVTAQHADTPITAPSVEIYTGQKTAPVSLRALSLLTN